MSIYSFEDGKYRVRRYLKPSGHIYEESESGYTVIEVRQLDGGAMEAIIDDDSRNAETRYFYDAEMNVVGTEESEIWSSGGIRHYYFDPLDAGVWSLSFGEKETDIPRNFGEYSYAPINFDEILGR